MTQSLKEDGRPATLWFWDDWFSSFDVRACSLAARGLWMDMLGIMARSEIIGTLTINGKQIDSTTLAKIAGTSEVDIETSLSELEGNRVFSRLPDGTIVNRRMFNGSQRKEMISKIKAAAGKKGAEARWQSDGKAIADPYAEDMAKMALPIQSKPIQTNKTKKGQNKSSACLRKFADVDIRLTQLLIDLMQRNNPDSLILKHLTEKRQAEWMNQCRLLREVDKRTEDQVERVIRFSQSDSFWKMNILSMPKLREKWDQLWLKAKAGGSTATAEDWVKSMEKHMEKSNGTI